MSKCLGEDVEVRVGEPVSPDALKKPPELSGIGQIDGIGLTRTVREHTTDTATDVGDDRARIARCRKDFLRVRVKTDLQAKEHNIKAPPIVRWCG